VEALFNVEHQTLLAALPRLAPRRAGASGFGRHLLNLRAAVQGHENESSPDAHPTPCAHVEGGAVKQTIAMSQNQVSQAMIDYAIKHSLVTAGEFEIVASIETTIGEVTLHLKGVAAAVVKPAPASPEVAP
jgi:hypothetical protein